MRAAVKCFFVLFILLIGVQIAYSQAKQNNYDDADNFEGGFLKPESVPDIPGPKRPLLKILKYDNKDLMTGNACVYEETVKMGFEYLVVCNKDIAENNKVWVFFYNLGTNLELTLKNGPGWRKRLKKRIVECRRNSGDFVW